MRAKTDKIVAIGAVALGLFLLTRQVNNNLSGFGSSFKRTVKKVAHKASTPIRAAHKGIMLPAKLVGMTPAGAMLDRTPLGKLKRAGDKSPLRNFGKFKDKKAKKHNRGNAGGNSFGSRMIPIKRSPDYPTAVDQAASSQSEAPDYYAPEQEYDLAPVETFAPDTSEMMLPENESVAIDSASNKDGFFDDVISDLNRMFA